jgi:hypothetical protein
MKKRYQQPAIREVKIQQQQCLLVGSNYSVNNYNNGGEETVSSDGGW